MREKGSGRIAAGMLAAFLLVPLLTSQGQSQAGWKPELMPREREIGLALSAGPAHFAEEAGIYVLEKSGYVKIRESKNGFYCFVGRSVPGSQEPECYDAEGSETRMQVELFEGGLRMQGKGRKEIEQAVAEGYASGKFRAPRRPGIVYMLSKENLLPIDEEGKTVLPYRPHLMFYAPYLTNADIGAKPGPGAPAFVLAEGTPGALIIVPVPKETSGAKAPSQEGVLDAGSLRESGLKPRPTEPGSSTETESGNEGGLDAGSLRESDSLRDSGLQARGTEARATKARPAEPSPSTSSETEVESHDEPGSAQEKPESEVRLLRLKHPMGGMQSNLKEKESWQVK